MLAEKSCGFVWVPTFFLRNLQQLLFPVLPRGNALWMMRSQLQWIWSYVSLVRLFVCKISTRAAVRRRENLWGKGEGGLRHHRLCMLGMSSHALICPQIEAAKAVAAQASGVRAAVTGQAMQRLRRASRSGPALKLLAAATTFQQHLMLQSPSADATLAAAYSCSELMHAVICPSVSQLPISPWQQKAAINIFACC